MKKILIVEDELVVRSIYRRKFEMAGYQVETAEEGTAALNILPTFKPDLIQVDIMMPGMDGVEVIRQIRAWPEFQATPILVLSSFYRPDLAKEAWKAGASKCVSKMDCTPNLALELVEQLLSGEDTGYSQKYGTIPLARGALDTKAEPQAQEPPADGKVKMTVKLDLPPSSKSTGAPRPATAEPTPPVADASGEGKIKLDLNLPPAKGAAPTLPSFAGEKEGATAADPAKPAFFGKTAPPPFKPVTRPTFASQPTAPAPAAALVQPAAEPTTPTPAAAESDTPAETSTAAGPEFRLEIRQEFLKRSPQILAELRERVGALIKSKSTTDQMKLMKELEATVSSLASLSGITGFSRISHLSGAMDALIKELNKKPNQMTASVLRTIAHAMDCMNVLFREITQMPQELPQSILILAVDDEPISRRTISVALGKANLRCIGMENSTLALTVLEENPFDLVFLDAEMPGMNGFELCAELRKLPTNKNTPVIFVTSLTKFEIRAQSSLSGGNDLIAKPFLMMELAVKALTYLLKPRLNVEAKPRPQPAAKTE